MSEKSNQNNIVIKNKRATFDYELVERFEAGIQLTGTEVKSIRSGKASLSESYCYFRKDELWIKNMHIAEYTKGNIYNHDPMRERKLLLKRRELNRLQNKTKEKGLTIVPVKLFFSERGIVKIEIALAKGKKSYDKRESIKEKDVKKEMNRHLKQRF